VTKWRFVGVGLVALGVYSLFVAVRATFRSDGHGPIFWSTAMLIAVLAVLSLWGGRRLWRHS
jgi:hypothetical protein